MKTGLIPANLHFKTPNPDIRALVDGSIEVAAVHTPLPGPYVAINSFGFGGSNVHAILQAPERTTTEEEGANEHPASRSQRLFVFAGRTNEGVCVAFDRMRQRATDMEMHALLEDNALVSPVTHPYRGYCVLNNANSVQEVQVGWQPSFMFIVYSL
jgi:fatty acid synthase